jgi:ABC-type lipoprotein release transport system permease subunit
MAYAVAQRQREIGVRLALGASPRQIRTVLLWRGMRTALMAVVAGLVIAVAGARLVRSLLFGIDPADPTTLAGAAVVLAGAALLACWFPARRAMRVDPLQVMRQE